jgi:hypothetical protein
MVFLAYKNIFYLIKVFCIIIRYCSILCSEIDKGNSDCIIRYSSGLLQFERFHSTVHGRKAEEGVTIANPHRVQLRPRRRWKTHTHHPNRGHLRPRRRRRKVNAKTLEHSRWGRQLLSNEVGSYERLGLILYLCELRVH